jgi:F0F1-type ATP synthase epsilon subunit
VTVLAGVAERAEEIDVARAELAKDASAQRLADLNAGRAPAGEEVEENVAIVEAESALARADLRLAVAAGDA